MQSRNTLHYLFRAVLTGGFSFYIIYLIKNDKLQYYIAPRMETIVKLSAIALGLIAVYLVFAALWSLQGTTPSCGCNHMPKKSPIKNTIAYALFAAPLLLGWFAPDTVMGSNVVDMKGIVLSKAAESAPAQDIRQMDNATANEPQQGGLFYSDDLFIKQYSAFAEQLYLQDPIIVKEETFLETISAIDFFMKPFRGKSIEISGFVYKQEDMADSQFVVARLGMDCCSADAMPYGFLVEWPEAKALQQDVWVKVRGAISSSDYDGMEIVTLHADNVESIATPETPYVYPNYEALE